MVEHARLTIEILGFIVSTVGLVIELRKTGRKWHVMGRKWPVIGGWSIAFIVAIAFLLSDHSYAGDSAFSIAKRYTASGMMGDIGDLQIQHSSSSVRFVYETKGRGDHEWNWKYKNGEINKEPAQFGGVMYLRPPDTWGTDPDGGADLRLFSDSVEWEARSLNGPATVEFLIGGVTWIWGNRGEKVTPPYPDTLPRTSLGIYELTPEWKEFTCNLREKHVTPDMLRRVVGGFGLVISWGANGVVLNDARMGPVAPKTFTIEIRNIAYRRDKQQ